MELTNEFTVALPPDRAWDVLTDLERIAPCLPGARLTEVDGDEHTGELKVKVGPITATYKGGARLVERDEGAHRIVLRAEGRDARQGDASATVTATLAEEGAGTRVDVVSDVSVGGKVGQFGRGVLADISLKLVDQFAAELNAQLEAEAPIVWAKGTAEPSGVVKEFAKAVVAAAPAPPLAPAPAPTEPGADAEAEIHAEVEEEVESEVVAAPRAALSAGPRRIESPEREPVDLLGPAATTRFRRLAPVGLVTGVVAVVVVLWRRRR